MSSDTSVQALPSVLILGGVNTVARHLAVYLCGKQADGADARSPLVKVSVIRYLFQFMIIVRFI